MARRSAPTGRCLCHPARRSVLHGDENRNARKRLIVASGSLGRWPASARQWLTVILGCAAWVASGACGEEPLTKPAAEVREPTVVVVMPTEVQLEVPDGAVQLSAEVRDQDGVRIVDAVVEWSSSDSMVATVSDSGLVAAVRTGNTDVTARHEALEASASIAVVGATVIVVAPAEAQLEVPDGTIQLFAEVLDQDGASIAGAVVEWSSADLRVATVSSSGLVAAVDTGSTHITARHATLEASASIAVVRTDYDPQRSALVALYEATGGPGWERNANWLTDAPLLAWAGVHVDETTLERVLKLDLNSNGLRGAVPPEIGDLAHLGQLYLSNNGLSGPLPSQIGNATGLHYLALSNNPLDGLLPQTTLRLWLDGFEYKGTGLCVPRSASFTRWTESIGTLEPEPCSPTRHDRLVLTELYHALGGPGWTRRDGWLSDLPLDKWDGVDVDTEGRVAGIELAANGVEGELPRSLGYLDALKRLDLRESHGLVGTVGDWMRELGSLDSLSLAGATLCIPPGRAFDDWLAALRDWSGSRCGEPSSIRTAIPMVYLVQAAQNRRGDVPLIAGRDALLRVFAVADELNYFDSEARAEFYLEGRMIHAATMTLGARRGIPLNVDESRKENSHTALIPGEVLVPGVRLAVVLDPDRKLPLKAGSQLRAPEVGELLLDVREMPPMELTVVPVRFYEEVDTTVVARASRLKLDSPELHLFRTMLPVQEVDFAVREPITVSMFDWSASAIGILETLRLTDGATGHYIGISSLPGGAAELPGKVSSSALDAIVIAHEIGHNLGLLHADCGEAPLLHVDGQYPYSGARTGVWGFDYESAELRGPTLPDVMSYCRPVWISDYHFRKALEFRETEHARAGHGRVTGGGRKTSTLLLWGRITAGGVHLEPAVVLDAVPSVPDGGGPYRIVGTDDSSQILFSLNFTPMVEAESGDEHFVLTVPVEAAWDGSLAGIAVSGPAGSDSLDHATRRPLAIVVDPASGRIRGLLRDVEAIPPAFAGWASVSYGLPGNVR